MKSMRRFLRYPTKPDENPKNSVNKATPMAAAILSKGYSGPIIGKTIMKIGANIAAPPIPDSMAVVATHIEIGNMNQ